MRMYIATWYVFLGRQQLSDSSPVEPGGHILVMTLAHLG